MRVKDDGIGIKKEDQEKLFSPFYRADNESTRNQQGTGLGLYIARTIVEAHGGQITLESELGKGTEVQIVLPAATSEPSIANSIAGDALGRIVGSRLDALV
jgi:two-component system sensor histidine kinase VicK